MEVRLVVQASSDDIRWAVERCLERPGFAVALELQACEGAGPRNVCVRASFDNVFVCDDMVTEHYVRKVQEFVSAGGLRRAFAFLDGLAGLASHARPDRPITLYKDYAENSFLWSQRGGLNGGLIYYAGSESGADAPQFSVSVGGRSDERWEVHT